jgi:hypothetical protein
MSKMFMVDLETTGTVIHPHPLNSEPPSKILQIAMLELNWSNEARLWRPGNLFEWLAYHEMPKKLNPFQEEHQKELFKRCSESRMIQTPSDVRIKMVNFMSDCGAKEVWDRKLCGWNASSFDVPLLHRDRFLYAPYTDNETDQLVGDHHYRIYELGGAIQYLENKTSYEVDRKEMLNEADKNGWAMMFTAFGINKDEISAGRGSHDGVFDCYNQTATLNGILHVD